LCNQTKKTIDDPKHMKFSGDGYFVHTSDEMLELFPEEYLDNTLEVADKVEYEPLGKGYHLPHFPLPEGFKNDDEYFKYLCKKGFSEKFKGKPEFKNPVYLERLKSEGEVIKQMGWPSYFLIVQDFIRWAEDSNVEAHWKDYFPNKEYDEIPKEMLKDYPIYVGSGRGSGAGSLINYCLGITKVDPIVYDLKFERFLNPDRISMPDIDTDFEDEGRGKVLDYVRFKYGKKNVANIITFGTAAAKNSIKTINRVLGYSVDNGDAITEMIPDKPGVKIKDALEDKDFKDLYNSNEDARKIIDYAQRIEGLKTSQSIHPCFLAGTKIGTRNGNIDIENVKEGMEVLTHRGLMKQVVKVMSRKTDDDVYEINIDGISPIRCTYNHPFLVRNIETGQVSWLEAGSIDINKHYLAYALTDVEKSRLNIVNSDDIRKFYPELRYCKNIIVCDYNLWIQIDSKELLPKEERIVYNLEVKDDHSYCANNIIVHNCGVLITDKEVIEYMPEVLLKDPDTGQDVWVSQMEGPTCEELGCLKMDFLGLRTLGYVHETIDSIKRNTGKAIDYEQIPLNDMNVYRYLAKGNTASMFQIESDMFTTVIRKTLKDTLIEGSNVTGEECFNRLVAMNALVRPGSNIFIDDFADYIIHPENAKYLVPELIPILKETYGIILYQEQTMRITRDLAGFSMGQADTVRKAMGKKKKYIMDEYKDYFVHGSKKMKIKGCVANGIPEDKASELWDVMALAASYSFNK